MNVPSCSSNSSVESSNSDSMVVSLPMDCEICGLPSHGKHYGAMSCRACAAFFRRYGASNQVKPCKKDGTCDFVKKGWFNCKKCRLQKCKNVGMKIDSFQFNRDPNRVIRTLFNNITPSMANFLGRPNFIMFCAPKEHYTKVIIDVQFLIDKAENVLLQGSQTPIFALNPLEKLALGLQQIRGAVGKEVKLFNKIGKAEAFALFEDEILRTAGWLTYYDDFQRLPYKLQLDMLKVIFKVWTRLDKLSLTARARQQNSLEKWQVKAHINNDQVICDLTKLELDISWCTTYTLEQLSFFDNKDSGPLFENQVQLMMSLNPTDVELAYMMCQLSFHYAGQRHQGIVLEIADQFLDTLSNHLHDYYVNRLNMPQYSKRVAQMMKINNCIQQEIIIERTKNKLMEVFDVFYAEYSLDIFRTV